MDEDRSWVKVGAKVAEVGSQSVGPNRTITKIGKRDIVLDDGSRYSVRWLTQQGADVWSQWRLVSADHPRVAALRRRDALQVEARKLEQCVLDLRRGIGTIDTLDAAQVALDECRKLL